MGPELDREQGGFVRPVFEDAPGSEEPRHVLRVEKADAGREREPVRAVDGRDRVQLYGGQAADRRLDVRLVGAPVTAAEALGADDRPADLCEGRDCQRR
jgi:hypothetical protein